MSPKRRDRFVLDTGPWLDHLGREYSQKTGALARPQVHCLVSDAQGAAFRRFLLRNRGFLVVTPGVLTELEHHRQRCRWPMAEFWDTALAEFRRVEIEEGSVPVLDPRGTSLLQRVGPVDAGLVAVVEDLGLQRQSARLVTIDGKLLKHCRQHAIPADDLWTVLTPFTPR